MVQWLLHSMILYHNIHTETLHHCQEMKGSGNHAVVLIVHIGWLLLHLKALFLFTCNWRVASVVVVVSVWLWLKGCFCAVVTKRLFRCGCNWMVAYMVKYVLWGLSRHITCASNQRRNCVPYCSVIRQGAMFVIDTDHHQVAALTVQVDYDYQ